jgi:dipeptidyl aminopeptidase/acylaminoacyl peptidase
MTYLALARTDRFRAAVIVAGVADSRTVVQRRPDMETYVYAELIPDYAEVKEEALLARSPLAWPEKLSAATPLLLLHGTGDWRVYPGDSIDMARALYELRHPVRLVLYEGADHSLSEFRDEAYDQIRSWLDRYVRDGEPLPDLEPHGP